MWPAAEFCDDCQRWHVDAEDYDTHECDTRKAE